MLFMSLATRLKHIVDVFGLYQAKSSVFKSLIFNFNYFFNAVFIDKRFSLFFLLINHLIVVIIICFESFNANCINCLKLL
jgi:hypothetical protein